MKLLDRYILREHFAPFLISNSLIMLLFTLNLAFRMLSRIVGQGLPLPVIAEYFILNLAWIITLSVPMSALIACLMAFGRLAGDFEIVAMKASGISLTSMIRPVLFAGLFVGLFSLYFQDRVLPEFNHRNKLLTMSIRKKKPDVAIREGTFTRDLPRQTLLVHEVDRESGMMYVVTIFDDSNDRQPSTVVADSGFLSFVDTLGMYEFKLYSGEIHQVDREEQEDYEILEFQRALFRFDAEDQLLRLRKSGYRGDRELSLAGLRRRIHELESREDAGRQEKQIDRYWVEYHKKYTISVAVLVFILIGAPLGVKLHRGGLGVSGSLSVLFFLVYWAFLIGGEDMADRGLVEPWIAMWTPNIILLILGIFLIRMEMRQHVTYRFPWQKRVVEEEEEPPERWDISEEQAAEYAEREARRQRERLAGVDGAGEPDRSRPDERKSGGDSADH